MFILFDSKFQKTDKYLIEIQTESTHYHTREKLQFSHGRNRQKDRQYCSLFDHVPGSEFGTTLELDYWWIVFWHTGITPFMRT